MSLGQQMTDHGVTTANDGKVSTPRAVLSVIAIILFMVFAALLYIVYLSYENTREAIDKKASNGAQVAATHVEWLVRTSLLTLDAIDRIEGATMFTSPAARQDDIKTLLHSLPGAVTFSLLDASGKLVFSTGLATAAITPAPIDEMRALPGDAWPYVSRLSDKADGPVQSFLIGRQVIRDGAVAGYAVLAVPADIMVTFWSSLDLGPKSTVGVVRDDGWLVARYPSPDKSVDLSNYVLFTDYLTKGPAGTYDAESPVDNERRKVGYRRIPNAPLVVLASVSQIFAMRAFWLHAAVAGSVLAALSLFFSILTLWIFRLLKRDETLREKLGASAEHNTLLLREIHHRVKNNLQAVSSLVQMQPLPVEAKQDMSARIAAMSAVHEQSYKFDQFDELDAASYLETVCENAKRSYGGSLTIANNFEPMLINRDTALPLGLIATEVIANAVKHAFKDHGGARIEVGLKNTGDGRAELVIQDNGSGYTPDGMAGGMGTRLIKAFGQQLGGEYSYRIDNGTRFAVSFATRAPLPPGG